MTPLTQSGAALFTALPPCLVRLEINNSGAWKCLARFNLSDADNTSHACRVGLSLVALDPRGKTTLRLSTDDALPKTLAYCKHATGWEWTTAEAGAR